MIVKICRIHNLKVSPTRPLFPHVDMNKYRIDKKYPAFKLEILQGSEYIKRRKYTLG